MLIYGFALKDQEAQIDSHVFLTVLSGFRETSVQFYLYIDQHMQCSLLILLRVNSIPSEFFFSRCVK